MTSVIFIGLLTFVLGKMLGLASLVSQPVTILTKDPDPDSIVPGTVYYQKGSRSGRTVWRAKEEAWKDGTVSVLSLSETELNQWSWDRFKMPTAPAGEEGASWRDRLQLHVAQLNIRILEDEVQLATEVKIGDFFNERTFIYQVRGKFVNTPSGVKFVHEMGTLGHAPFGAFPLYGDLVFSMVMNQYPALEGMEWLTESFDELESVEIADGQLVLRRRAES
jgi:hypothetical protein